jgi:hypothetical protein
MELERRQQLLTHCCGVGGAGRLAAGAPQQHGAPGVLVLQPLQQLGGGGAPAAQVVRNALEALQGGEADWRIGWDGDAPRCALPVVPCAITMSAPPPPLATPLLSSNMLCPACYYA